MQRIQLLRSSSENWKSSEKILLKGEVCLVMNETETGYNSLVIGDGQTMAKSLDRIFLGVKDGSVYIIKDGSAANLITLLSNEIDWYEE